MNIRNKIILNELDNFPELSIFSEIQGLVSNLDTQIERIYINQNEHSILFKQFFPKQRMGYLHGFLFKSVSFRLNNGIRIDFTFSKLQKSNLLNTEYSAVTLKIHSFIYNYKAILKKVLTLNKKPFNSKWVIEKRSEYLDISKSAKTSSTSFQNKLNDRIIAEYIKEILRETDVK